jgi:hypothetical protein
VRTLIVALLLAVTGSACTAPRSPDLRNEHHPAACELPDAPAWCTETGLVY